MPENVDEIVVLIDVIAMPIQELRYETAYLRLFREREIGPYELDILTPFKKRAAQVLMLLS